MQASLQDKKKANGRDMIKVSNSIKKNPLTSKLQGLSIGIVGLVIQRQANTPLRSVRHPHKLHKLN
jgi:hypothetical protein